MVQFKNIFLYSMFGNFSKVINQDHTFNGIMAYNVISFLKCKYVYLHFAVLYNT